MGERLASENANMLPCLGSQPICEQNSRITALNPFAVRRASLCSQVYGFSSRNPDPLLELLANSPGLTSLMLAALLGHANAARALLERGASLSLVNCYGRSPLMLAAMAGQEELVALLLSVGAAPDGVDSWGRDAAAWAEQRNHPHIVRLIQTAKRERKQWMISQMRGIPPGMAAKRFAQASGESGRDLHAGEPAAFDAVAERAERGEMRAAQNYNDRSARAVTAQMNRAEAKQVVAGTKSGGRAQTMMQSVFTSSRKKSACAGGPSSSATSSATSSSSGSKPAPGDEAKAARGGARGMMGFLSGRGGGTGRGGGGAGGGAAAAAGGGGGAKRGSPGFMSPTRAGQTHAWPKRGAKGHTPPKGAGGAGGSIGGWLFSSRKNAAPADVDALLAPPKSVSPTLAAGRENSQKQRPANEEEEAIARVEDSPLTHDLVDAFIPNRSARVDTYDTSGRKIPGYMTPQARGSVRGSARSALSMGTGRSIVYSTRSMPGYMTQYITDTRDSEVHDLWGAVQDAVAVPNSSRPAFRGVVPLSAVPAGRVHTFHGKDWEAALLLRHERRIDDAPRISEADKRATRSSRRRRWVNSSRRWIEEREERKKTRTKKDGIESRRRLYSARSRDKIPARVYA